MLIVDEKVSRAMRRQIAANPHARGVYSKSLPERRIAVKIRELLDGRRRIRQAPRTYQGEREREERVDSLTGLYTRKGFNRMLGAEIAHAFYNKSPLGLLMVTPIEFEAFANLHGSLAANAVLTRTALVLRSESRSRDTVARYSDHVFSVVLPETPFEGIGAVARRLNHILSTTELGDVDRPFPRCFATGVAWHERAGSASGRQLCTEALVGLAPS